MLLQIIVTVAVLFAASRVLLLLKSRSISKGMAALWTMVWIAVLVIVFWPQTLGWISDVLGVQRGVDAAVYVSTLLLFYLMFRTNAKIDNTERRITELVREMALKNEKK